MIMEMSLETFWGGKEGSAEFEAGMTELNAGLDIATGAAACKAALRAFGASKIGIVTPYQPVGDEQVRRYFSDEGFRSKLCWGSDVRLRLRLRRSSRRD
jgi:maleate isomerase